MQQRYASGDVPKPGRVQCPITGELGPLGPFSDRRPNTQITVTTLNFKVFGLKTMLSRVFEPFLNGTYPAQTRPKYALTQANPANCQSFCNQVKLLAIRAVAIPETACAWSGLAAVPPRADKRTGQCHRAHVKSLRILESLSARLALKHSSLV